MRVGLDGFWYDRSVFVTGHTGFKGSWLSVWLQLLGARVTGFALPPRGEPNLFEDANVAAAMRSMTGDVREIGALEHALAEAEPEIVFHLAAQPIVRRSYADPLGTITSNVLGTANLLEAVRHTPSVRVVVVVTTDKVYENNEWHWGYREADTLGGRDPYSASKACAELVAAAYRESFFDRRVALATVRAGNVIGGGDWSEDRIVPDIVRAIARGNPVEIRSPRAVRPWQHVLEPLGGYLLVAERLWSAPELCGAYNFGPLEPEPVTVQQLAGALVEHLQRGVLSFDESSQHGAHEANWLRLDCSKAQAVLGWRPRLTTREAVALTAAWYKSYLDDRSLALPLVRRQLLEYIHA